MKRFVSSLRVISHNCVAVVTYCLVLDPVDLWVQFTILGQMMLNLANLENSSLLEGPGGQLFGKLTVSSLRILSVTRSFDGGGEPLVLETLDGAQKSETGRIPGLHGRNKSQLGTRSRNILNRAYILLGVVAVSSCWGAQNGSKKWVGVAQSVRGGPWESQNALAAEECLGITSQLAGALKKEDIMLFIRRESVIVEVVNDNRGPVGRQMKVKFQQERADGAGCGGLAGKREKDVAVFVHEFDEGFGAQRRSKACITGQLTWTMDQIVFSMGHSANLSTEEEGGGHDRKLSLRAETRKACRS